LSSRPARLAGLGRKGRIAPGFDADFCILAPDEPFVVDPSALRHKQPVTPYAGRTLTGTVRATILRGEHAGIGRPRGELVLRADR
jgi:allantoinase